MLRTSSRGIQKLRRPKRRGGYYEKMMKTLLLQNQQIIIQQQNMMFMVMKQCHQQSPSPSASASSSDHHQPQHQQQQQQQNHQHHHHHHQEQQQQHMPTTGQLTIIHGQQEQQHTQITLSGHSQQQQHQHQEHPAIHQLQPHSEPSHLNHQDQHLSQSQSHLQQQQQQNHSTPPTPASHGQRSNGSSQQQQQQQQHHHQQQSHIMHPNQQTNEQEHSIHHQFVGHHHQNGNTDASLMETHKQLQQVANHLQDSLGSYLTPAASEQDPISDSKSAEEDLSALLENDGLLTNNLLYNPQTDIGSVTPYKNHQHQQQTPSYYSSGCESLTTPRVEQPRQSTTNISQNVVKNLADSFKSPTKPKINVQILSNSATRNMKNSKAKIIQTMNISEFLRQVHHDEGPKSSQ